ncbi:hypothetical protein VPH35_090960 [Triticum aestivum]
MDIEAGAPDPGATLAVAGVRGDAAASHGDGGWIKLRESTTMPCHTEPQQWMMQNLLMDHSQHGFQYADWVQLLIKIWTT